MTISITTFNITNLSDDCLYVEHNFAECRGFYCDLIVFMLNVIKLSILLNVILLKVIMLIVVQTVVVLNVIILRAIMLRVVAPFRLLKQVERYL